MARLWWNRDDAAEYLRALYKRTLAQRQGLQQTAAKVPGSKKWATTRTAADVDLARVYAVAAQCVKLTVHFVTYKEFAAAMNQVRVWQLASELPGEGPWTSEELHQAAGLVLRSQRGSRS